ncbi:MAG: flagellar basal body P-ring protein FlgI [Desulfatibacillum sp.]|nr:flagellar basal body P-ring protein FlgI [Desulfatibacillum sp.]
MSMNKKFALLILLAALVFCLAGPTAHAARIKELASIKGVRSNQLIGYGLVVGLNGTGDKSGTEFTIQGLVNMMERMGVHVSKDSVKVKNVAAVMVTADIPPFAGIGNKVDVVLSSVGDAKSLVGGTLLLTPLRGVDRNVYALAQGPLSVGGFSVGGAGGGGAVKNHPTVGRIVGGASVEREIPMRLQGKEELTLELNDADFTTALRMKDAINSSLGLGVAHAVDSGSVVIDVPQEYRSKMVSMVSLVENLEVRPDTVAKVIVNEKTGTVVVGEKVRVSTVAVAHGNLSIQISESAKVSQPVSFSPPPPPDAETQQLDLENGAVVAPGGQTVVTADTQVVVAEENKQLMIVPTGTTIGELVRALNAIGVTPRDLITIFQMIKAAGALQGELVIL